MKHFVIILLLIVAGFLGSSAIKNFPSTKTIFSDIKTERVKVSETVYTPSTHGNGSSTGLTMDGKMVFSSVSVRTEAKYATVFQCIHGKFIVEDSTIWAHMTRGDEGVCLYVEEYECNYRGKQAIEKPQLVGYKSIAFVFGQDTIWHRR